MLQNYIKKSSYVKLFVTGIVFGFILSLTTIYFGIDLNHYLSQLNFMMVLISIFITIILSIASHELGHLVFGLLSGYEFKELNILGFKFKKVKDHFKFSFDLSLNKLFGGLCLMFPPESTLGEHPYKLIGYGGIITNTFLLFIGIMILILSNGTYALEWGISIILVNLILVIDNLRYNPEAHIYNDGTQIRVLTQSKKDRIAHHTLLLISQDISNHIPFSTSIHHRLPDNFELGDSYYQLNLVYFKYLDYMVHNNIEAAYALLASKEHVALQQTTLIDTMILAQLSYMRLLYDYDGDQYFDVESFELVLHVHEDWLLLYAYNKIIKNDSKKQDYYRDLISKEINDLAYDPLLQKYYQTQRELIESFIR